MMVAELTGRDLLRHELQAILDSLLRRGVDQRAMATAANLAVIATVHADEPRRRDLCVTTHDSQRRSLADLLLVLTDSRGSTITAPFSDAGQAIVRGVGPAPWMTRVTQVRPGTPAVPQLIINRSLPLAATFGVSELDYAATDLHGRVALTLHEDEEQHLHAVFSGALPPGCLARVRWSTAGRGGVEAARTLVSPLIETADGAIASYDLGPLAQATTIQVFPVEIITASDIDRVEVEQTLATTWRGSSRRAWREWLNSVELEPELHELLDRAAG
jgi:hypothetical protein